MGQKVNTTAPADIPTPIQTINITYETKLAKIRLNNRTVDNRGDVYIGEKNLDVSGAIGWMQPDGSWQVQYCDYYGNDYNKTITIPNPHHFDITSDMFSNDYGAWCQYSTYEAGRERQPVAFWVLSSPPEFMQTPTPALTENQTVNITPTEDVLNVTITPEDTTYTPQPTEPMASDTIVVPLPWWIAIVAVGFVLWRKK
jgi:hypothetical protein